jgi:Immunity protein 26
MRSRDQIGLFLRIPLEDGSFAYARNVAEPYTAFYNYRTREPSDDLDVIEAQPILFATAVRTSTMKGWAKLGKRPLTGDAAKPVVSFHQDLFDYRKCVIYDTDGMERTATPEECEGLEPSSVWDAHHIESRLLDTFEGRPNKYAARVRPRYSDD